MTISEQQRSRESYPTKYRKQCSILNVRNWILFRRRQVASRRIVSKGVVSSRHGGHAAGRFQSSMYGAFNPCLVLLAVVRGMVPSASGDVQRSKFGQSRRAIKCPRFSRTYPTSPLHCLLVNHRAGGLWGSSAVLLRFLTCNLQSLEGLLECCFY